MGKMGAILGWWSACPPSTKHSPNCGCDQRMTSDFVGRQSQIQRIKAPRTNSKRAPSGDKPRDITFEETQRSYCQRSTKYEQLSSQFLAKCVHLFGMVGLSHVMKTRYH